MKRIIIKIGILILKTIYCPMKLLKVKNKIVYISRQFNHPNLDFTLIATEISNLDPTIKNVFLTKRLDKGFIKKILYMFHMTKQMYHIATAKIIITDSYCMAISLLKHKKGTKVIQLWHAIGAIKKFGYQTIGKKSGSDEQIAKLMHMHANYDVVLCSSYTTGKHYCEAFNVNEDNIKYIGMPRIDYILKTNNADEIYNKYPQLKSKINILYVPTFRKGKKIKLNQLIEKIDTNTYNLIIKLHPLDRKEYKYTEREGIIFEDKLKSYDLFSVADKIVTDYSSLAIEASLLDKPIYFYTYDLDEYEIDPGLNFDFKKEPIGKYMAKTPRKLLELFKEEYDYSILQKFKNKYISVDTNECTKQLSMYLLELMKNENKENIKEETNPNIKRELNI